MSITPDTREAEVLTIGVEIQSVDGVDRIQTSAHAAQAQVDLADGADIDGVVAQIRQIDGVVDVRAN